MRDIAARRSYSPGHSERLRGPVMFVDLAGFTPLVVSLCAAGQRGIETLQGILSSYFEELIEGNYAHGGDVFGFAGDVMLVGFSTEDGESDADAAARAVASAAHARATLAAYEDLDVLGQHHRMRLKFGLSFGDYHYLLLGHDDFWCTPLLLGGPVRTAIDAEHHAGGGEVLVDEHVWSRLPSPKSGSSVNGFFKLDSVREGRPKREFRQQLPDTGHGRELLESCPRFIEPVLFRKATTSHSGFTGEYREVTCLLARFAGLTMQGDVDDTISTLNGIYRHVQESAKTYGAILNRVELGDKGFVFLFILGAPTAMENKSTLAGRLALKGIPEPVDISRLHSEASRHQRGLLHLSDEMVGRSAELSRLLDLREQTLATSPTRRFLWNAGKTCTGG